MEIKYNLNHILPIKQWGIEEDTDVEFVEEQTKKNIFNFFCKKSPSFRWE